VRCADTIDVFSDSTVLVLACIYSGMIAHAWEEFATVLANATEDNALKELEAFAAKMQARADIVPTVTSQQCSLPHGNMD